MEIFLVGFRKQRGFSDSVCNDASEAPLEEGYIDVKISEALKICAIHDRAANFSKRTTEWREESVKSFCRFLGNPDPPVSAFTPSNVRAFILHRSQQLKWESHTSTKTFEKTVSMVTERSVTAHTFRSIFAVKFLRNGGDVFALKRILGHSSLEMSNRYSTLANIDIKAAHERSSVLDRLRF